MRLLHKKTSISTFIVQQNTVDLLICFKQVEKSNWFQEERIETKTLINRCIRVLILLHTNHFTGFVLSVSTDCASIKGLKDVFTQYLEEDCNTWQIRSNRDNKSCSAAFKKDGEITALIGEK